MESVWPNLKSSLLKLIAPSDTEVMRLTEFLTKVESGLTSLLKKHDIDAKAEIHGSASRGTWISGDKDIDVFIILDPKSGRAVIPLVIEVVKEYVGEGWVEAYAEHPYIKAIIDDFNVDFVPCFRVDPSKGLISATDRTPLHTEFLRTHLKREARLEVLLLKQFMKGIGVYGAEVKIGGFSGYLCELLVLYYGTFSSVVTNASQWKPSKIIDLYGDSKLEELQKLFSDPLIVLDPVDSSRNVASPVTETSFSVLVAASRAFLKLPDIKFFYPISRMVGDLYNDILTRPSCLIFVILEDGCVDVPDVLWGELYKSLGGLTSLLVKHGFNVLRSTVWSDESSVHVMIFEVESSTLPDVEKRRGPPINLIEGSERFIRAHLGVNTTISGPWIEGDWWWVLKRRGVTDAKVILTKVLADGGIAAGVSRKLGERVKESFRILLDDEFLELEDHDFKVFVTNFIDGRPGWLG